MTWKRMVFLLSLAPVSAGAQNLGGQAAGNVAVAALPLATYPQGQQMMAQAVQNAALLNVHFQFLNQTYENDVYVREPITGKKVRTSCVQFKATSGFQFKVDQPAYTLTNQGLRVEQNISKITADGLTAKFMLGPCVWVSTGVGVRLSDVKLIYKAKPMISFQNNRCSVSWSQQHDELTISIGDLNITGVQNDIDKLVKNAAREALNAALDAYFGGKMRGELMKVSVNVCGGGGKAP